MGRRIRVSIKFIIDNVFVFPQSFPWKTERFAASLSLSLRCICVCVSVLCSMGNWTVCRVSLWWLCVLIKFDVSYLPLKAVVVSFEILLVLTLFLGQTRFVPCKVRRFSGGRWPSVVLSVEERAVFFLLLRLVFAALRCGRRSQGEFLGVEGSLFWALACFN
jgi:hypothetical protein